MGAALLHFTFLNHGARAQAPQELRPYIVVGDAIPEPLTGAPHPLDSPLQSQCLVGILPTRGSSGSSRKHLLRAGPSIRRKTSRRRMAALLDWESAIASNAATRTVPRFRPAYSNWHNDAATVYSRFELATPTTEAEFDSHAWANRLMQGD